MSQTYLAESAIASVLGLRIYDHVVNSFELTPCCEGLSVNVANGSTGCDPDYRS